MKMHSYRTPLLSIAGIIAIAFTAAVTCAAQGEMRVTVDANKEASFQLPIAVNRRSLKFLIDPEEIASIRFDTNDRLIVKGLTPGEGSIVITGTRNAIAATGQVQEQKFRQTVAVQVLPRRDVDSLTRPISVGKGADGAKVLTVGYIMSPGQEFANINAEGINWRQLFYVGGNSSIAMGELFTEGNVRKIRITGAKDGKTTLKLLGERRVANTWQSVERILAITVGTGRPQPETPDAKDNGNNGQDGIGGIVPDPTIEVARNKIVDAIERSYAKAKEQIDRSGNDNNEAARLLSELEAMVALIDERMKKEDPYGSGSDSRWMRLQKIKDKVVIDIRLLKDRLNKPQKPEAETPLKGKWRLEINGQKQSGEYTFRGSAALVLLYKDEQMSVLILGPGSENRSVSIPAQAVVRFGFGRQLIQLRGNEAAGRLEFWATPDESSSVFQKTSYTLVREDRPQ